MADARIDLPASPRARGRWIRQTIVGLLMLPLSLLPFVAYATNTPEGELIWTRARVQVDPPELPTLADDDARWIERNAPSWSDAAAVLVYHGIGEEPTEGTGQTITEERFGEHLQALRTAGMTPITVREFARACESGTPLPDNAVAVTFDDGRSRAMILADPLLEQAGWRATMFTISGAAEEPGVFYAGWDDLRDFTGDGTWDLQGHTHAMHDTVPDPAVQRPLLVNRLPGESLDAWRQRVLDDLDTADTMLAEHADVPPPVAFAYPFGAHGGDDRTNDPRIADELHDILSDRYALAFQQDGQDDVPLASCDQDPMMLRRLDVDDWDARELVSRLRQVERDSRDLERD